MNGVARNIGLCGDVLHRGSGVAALQEQLRRASRMRVRCGLPAPREPRRYLRLSLTSTTSSSYSICINPTNVGSFWRARCSSYLPSRRRRKLAPNDIQSKASGRSRPYSPHNKGPTDISDPKRRVRCLSCKGLLLIGNGPPSSGFERPSSSSGWRWHPDSSDVLASLMGRTAI